MIQNLDPEYLARELRTGEILCQIDDAERALFKTAPTTLEGVAALLRYAYEFVASGNDWADWYLDHGPGKLEDWNSQLHRHLAEAVTNIAVRSAEVRHA